MLTGVTIDGHGIAACCCAALLSRRDIEVSLTQPRISPGPTLLINPSTQKLLVDVFGAGDELFSDFSIVRRRVVLWGDESTPIVLPHSGVVVSEAVLLAKLWRNIETLCHPWSGTADWHIYSTFQSMNAAQRHFGSRIAYTSSVELKNADDDACWIESLDSGWLFLIPCGGQRGSLIAVGEDSSALLDQSRLVAQQIERVLESGTAFPAYPRILDLICAPGWLACGSAAMSFDPICGEGVGHAVREAILASAVIGSLATCPDVDHVLTYYSSRLLMGFLRHLVLCRQFYASARRSRWWSSELSKLDEGIEWSRLQLANLPEPQYRLTGFSLEPVRLAGTS